MESGVRGKGKVDRIHLLRPELLAPLSLELNDLATLNFKLAEIDLNEDAPRELSTPWDWGPGGSPAWSVACPACPRSPCTSCARPLFPRKPDLSASKNPRLGTLCSLDESPPLIIGTIQGTICAVFCGTCKPTVEQKIRFHVWLPSICGRSRTRPEAMLLSDAKTGKNLC